MTRRELAARHAAAVRWGLPGARDLGRQMAVQRAETALIELYRYRPLDPSDTARLRLLLDGDPPPWVLR